MAIISSVGLDGVNDKTDAKIIQAALNLVQSENFKLDKNLLVDGDAGKKTVSAIQLFQEKVAGLSKPDGVVDAGGRTLRALNESIKKELSEDALIAIMAMGKRSTINTYYKILYPALEKYQVNTPLRVSHFLAQVGHESLSFVYTEELASGDAYEGRSDLGNTEEGDGVRFKGRGLIQLTGRDNYSKYGKHVSVDFLKKGNEQLISSTPEYALDVSLWFWASKKLNRYADQDDLRGITRRVNGGYNGLDDRQLYLDRAKFFLV